MEASHEEILRALRLLALAKSQQLEEGKTTTHDPYDSYIQGLTLQLFKQFEDLPSALTKGYDILTSLKD